jgi:hypothetical protein
MKRSTTRRVADALPLLTRHGRMRDPAHVRRKGSPEDAVPGRYRLFLPKSPIAAPYVVVRLLPSAETRTGKDPL